MDTLQIKQAVRRRDGMRCTRCGLTNAESRAKYGRSLDVHRTNPGSEYSVEPGVCVTLCIDCHSSEPRQFIRQSMDEFAKQVSEAIRGARESAGWTQGQLAEALGIRVPHISRLEKGTHLPSVATLKKVSDALEVPICSLLDSPKPKGKK